MSAGTRRITALTGARATEHVEQIRSAGEQAAKLLGVAAHEIANAVTALSHHARELRKQISSGSSTSSTQPKVKSDEGKANVKGSFEQMKQALAEAGRQLSVAIARGAPTDRGA